MPHTKSGWAGASPAKNGPGWGDERLHDVNVAAAEALVAPRLLREQLPAGDKATRTIAEGRAAIQQMLGRSDQRMMVIVGPCSIHDSKAALEYADRLAELRQRVIDRMSLVMRVYFEKPRTTVGWKGLINDPHLDGSWDVAEGLHVGRDLLRQIADRGLPTATEFLDPIVPQYIADLVAWAAIGARTTESQTHRQMASGLSMPVGFKNSTDGNIQVAIEAMLACRSAHAFLGVDDDGRTSVIRTRGNPYGHMILRGGRERSNFDAPDVADAAGQLRQAGLMTNLMIDCSHANSRKKHEQQHVAWESAITQRAEGNRDIVGLMLESHLKPGNQKMSDDPSKLEYGKSITDACVGWEETERLILWAYENL
jgi:3-deoxy-7-phosphoheptulonate synthase